MSRIAKLYLASKGPGSSKRIRWSNFLLRWGSRFEMNIRELKDVILNLKDVILN